MTDRQEIEKKVAGLQEMVQRIESELVAKKVGVKNLLADRAEMMRRALRLGKRADVKRVNAEIAQLKTQVEGLTVEVEVGQNVLAHAEEELEPFLVRERLLGMAELWEAVCYEVKGLYDRRGDNWEALKDYHLRSWRRDELGLAILVDAGVAAEGELRRHGGESNYLAGLDHYPVFTGLYPECIVILRRLQRELRGSAEEPPMVTAVSGRAISQALQESHDDSVNRLRRYRQFEAFYAPELPEEPAPLESMTVEDWERGTGVIYHW